MAMGTGLACHRGGCWSGRGECGGYSSFFLALSVLCLGGLHLLHFPQLHTADPGKQSLSLHIGVKHARHSISKSWQLVHAHMDTSSFGVWGPWRPSLWFEGAGIPGGHRGLFAVLAELAEVSGPGGDSQSPSGRALWWYLGLRQAAPTKPQWDTDHFELRLLKKCPQNKEDLSLCLWEKEINLSCKKCPPCIWRVEGQTPLPSEIGDLEGNTCINENCDFFS